MHTVSMATNTTSEIRETHDIVCFSYFTCFHSCHLPLKIILSVIYRYKCVETAQPGNRPTDPDIVTLERYHAAKGECKGAGL